MLGMAAALVLGPWVAGAGAQSTLTVAEVRREYYTADVEAVTDEPVELAHWQSGNDKWVYVAGWMSVPQVSGSPAIVMAVTRYKATDMNGFPVETAYYPPNPTSELGAVVYKATGIVVDAENGDVYICGEGTALTGTTDYYILKYDKDLAIYTSGSGVWSSTGSGLGVRRYDSGYADRPADIIVTGTGANKRVIVTGSSGSASDGDDYYTIGYNASDGSVVWSDRLDHDSGDDQPVEMAAWEVAEQTETVPAGFYVAVAGTSYDSTTGQDFMIVRYRASNGDATGPARYDPMGDDVCTGIGPAKQMSSGGSGAPVGLCGSTTPNTGSPTDTAMVIATFEFDLTSWWTTTNSARIWNPGEYADIAVDIAQDDGVFWATGSISANADGDMHDLGVMAYTATTSATLVGNDTYGAASDGLDTVPASIHPAGTGVYIAGTLINTNNDPSDHFLLLHYTHDAYSAIDLDGVGLYHDSTGMEHTGRAVGYFFDSHRFVTGRSGAITTGVDWLTLRY